MQVRIAPDPQLAVCKGMVADRVRKLKSGKAVLGWRCSRASYGTICRIKYNKKNPDHIGKKTERDSDNGKLYITKAVAWFIKKVRLSLRLLYLNVADENRANQYLRTSQLSILSAAKSPLEIHAAHSPQTSWCHTSTGNSCRTR